MVKRIIIETVRQSYILKFAYLKDNRRLLFHPFWFFLESWGDTCGLWCVGGHCGETFANVGFRWNLMKALNASGSCDQCRVVQCAVWSMVQCDKADGTGRTLALTREMLRRNQKGCWVSLRTGFNSSTGVNAEASAYGMSQTKEKQEPNGSARVSQPMASSSSVVRRHLEVYSSTWKPLSFSDLFLTLLPALKHTQKGKIPLRKGGSPIDKY